MNFAIFIDRGSSLPLYSQLEDAIKQEIISGNLAYGDKLPSENELVSELGLSRMTVRSALADLENGGYVKKYHGKGSFVCYLPEETAQKRIDVLLDVTYAYFSTHYIKSISEVLSKHDYQFVIHDTQDDENVIDSIINNVLSTDSAGVIIQPSHRAGADGGLLRSEAVKLMQKGIPFVIIDSRPKDVPGCCVAFDDFKGAALAASYLAELGHKKFAMASCPQFSENGERRNGFESVIEEKGLGPLIEIEVGEGFEGRVCSAVRDGGATAVFAYNDEVAISVYRALAAEKISVPDDVSVVGYDDTLFAKAANPPLTSIVHPKEQLGRTAAEKLLSIITKTRYEIPKNAFEPNISVRGSCASPKKQRRD